MMSSEQKLRSIEEFMKDRYYAPILEEIPDFYDRLSTIKASCISLKKDMDNIQINHSKLVVMEKDIGTTVSMIEFEELGNSIHHAIEQYKLDEISVSQFISELFGEVEETVNNATDSESSIIPLNKFESDNTLFKQSRMIESLTQQRNEALAHKEMLENELRVKQERVSASTLTAIERSQELKDLKEKLSYLHGLKRIVGQMFGITSIEQDGAFSRISLFQGSYSLIIQTVSKTNTTVLSAILEPDLNGVNELFVQAIESGVKDSSFFVRESLYSIYSLKQRTQEFAEMKQLYAMQIVKQTPSSGCITVTCELRKEIRLTVVLPKLYPQTMDSLVVEKVESLTGSEGNVDLVKNIIRKQNFVNLKQLVHVAESVL